jgi:hypothetical protein
MSPRDRVWQDNDVTQGDLRVMFRASSNGVVSR